MDLRTRVDLMCDVGAAERQIGRLRDAVSTYLEAAAIARSAGDDVRLAQCAIAARAGSA